MANEPENLILRILQEMRDEMRSRYEITDQRLAALTDTVDELKRHVDGNTLTFNLVAGVVYGHEQRVTALEQLRSALE